MSEDAVIDEIFEAFRARGAVSYVGEPVSLTEHMLQTARGVALNEALVPLGAWGKAHVLSASPAPGQVGEDDHVALVPGTA